MVVRMRATRSHTRNRRSHHALKNKSIIIDKDTKIPHLSHRVCMETGKYRGRQIIDVLGKKVKKYKNNKEVDVKKK